MSGETGTQMIVALTGVGGVVAGSLISWFVQERLLSQRINADRELAEDKFEFEKSLAESRFRYDRDLHDHKRKVEFAELVLAQFLQAQDIISEIRRPAASSKEAAERQPEETETPEQRRELDIYYVPLARIRKNAEFFAALMSKKYQAHAILGEVAYQCFDELQEIIRQIHVSAATMMSTIHRGRTAQERNEALWQKYESDIWEGYGPDSLQPRLAATIKKIEEVCRGILEGKGP